MVVRRKSQELQSKNITIPSCAMPIDPLNNRQTIENELITNSSPVVLSAEVCTYSKDGIDGCALGSHMNQIPSNADIIGKETEPDLKQEAEDCLSELPTFRHVKNIKTRHLQRYTGKQHLTTSLSRVPTPHHYREQQDHSSDEDDGDDSSDDDGSDPFKLEKKYLKFTEHS